MTELTARAPLLDMDGTLVDSDAVVERIWRRRADAVGVEADPVLKVVHGRQGHATMAALLPERPAERRTPAAPGDTRCEAAGASGRPTVRLSALGPGP